MNAADLFRNRRSIREFSSREPTRDEIESLLDHAVTAPNLRLTQPWRFYVLGPEARRQFGVVLGGRKAKKIEDPTAAEQMRQKIGDEHASLPAMIVVAILQNENPEIREEDYAAGMMAVHNIMLAATDMGLGTHLKSGAVMNDPGVRAALGIPDDQRIIATLNVGEPANVPPAKTRRPATEVTSWIP